MADTKSDRILASTAHELKENEPRVVSMTRRKFGATRALAQKRAILLNKARSRGARIGAPK